MFDHEGAIALRIQDLIGPRGDRTFNFVPSPSMIKMVRNVVMPKVNLP